MARPKINPDFAELTCKVCGQPFKSPWSKRHLRKYCSKSCANHDPEVLEKMRASQKETSRKKYGTDHPMQTTGVVENFKASMLKTYGAEHALQIKSFKDKAVRTTLENHGVVSVLSKDSPFKQKIVEGWIEKFGVDNPGKSPEVQKKRSHTREVNHFEHLQAFFKSRKLKWLATIDSYVGYYFTNKYEFECETCGTHFESNVYHPDTVVCERCFPLARKTGENTLHEFLCEELPGVVINRHDRTTLGGKELDFFIPSFNLAIEYDGLYWHSESVGHAPKNYHLHKTEECAKKGIRLIHIFEPEWLYKNAVVRSMLRTMLGRTSVRIFARECEIRKLTAADNKESFIDECHIQGNDRCTVSYGLFYKGALVSVMSFVKSRFDQHIEWEISRFCTSLNTKVVGGASKLFKNFLEDYSPKSVVSYADRRFFTGETYNKLGMTFAGNTPQGYYYVSPDFKGMFNRMMFQKKNQPSKLKIFDPNLSEWQNMQANGFDRIWDCGNLKFVWKSEPMTLTHTTTLTNESI